MSEPLRICPRCDGQGVLALDRTLYDVLTVLTATPQTTPEIAAKLKPTRPLGMPWWRETVLARLNQLRALKLAKRTGRRGHQSALGEVSMTKIITALALLVSACNQGEQHAIVPSQNQGVYVECNRTGSLRTAGRVRGLCRAGGSAERSGPGWRDRAQVRTVAGHGSEPDHPQARRPGGEAGERQAGDARRPQGGLIYGVQVQPPTGRVVLRSGRSAPVWCDGGQALIAESWVDRETTWDLLRAQRDPSLIREVRCR